MKQYNVVFIKNALEHKATVFVDACETEEEEINAAKEEAVGVFGCELVDIISVELV